MKKSYKFRNLIIDPSDHCVLNKKQEFVPEDFNHDNISDDCLDAVLDYLNRIRIEWVSLKYNGMPRNSYKEDVAQKIITKKNSNLHKHEKRAESMMQLAGITPIERSDVP